MTWTRTVPVATDDTFQQAAAKIDVTELSEDYRHQFKVALAAAERLIGVDELPATSDGTCQLLLAGYISDTTRHISVSVLGFKP